MNLLNIIKPAYAISNPVLKNGEEQVNNPGTYTATVLQAIFSIFFIVAVLYFTWHFVFSAYHMIASNGDPKKLDESRKAVVNALVGLLLVFCVFAILRFVGTVLGIEGLDALKLTWPSL